MTVARAFALQAEACFALGSPFTARLMAICGARLSRGTSVADRIFAWPGDIGYAGASVPLRLAGALHGLVLGGKDAALAHLYADPGSCDDDLFWHTVAAALDRHAAQVHVWLNSAPQTNEVRRSAVLIAAGRWVTARFGLPLVLSELGASAGLNLRWDRYALLAGGSAFGPDAPALTLSPDWQGALPAAVDPEIADRAGTDLNPLDPDRDRVRILSYIWPDQTDRIELTRAALAEARRTPAKLATADAADWLEARLATPFEGQAHMVFHTIAWQYFPPAVQARCRAALARAGEQATPRAPLVHFGMENDPEAHGALLSMQVWPGGSSFAMGRADAHGRRIDWTPPEM